MTFKHLKFAESSTMQAFEKLAQSKGLVKPEVVTKTASKTLDLNPSENLLENILKLAQGLRSQGFTKHANDLENKFLAFKQADSLYETSKETGEDVVDQAHPQGSHKMDGQDHTVLTIVDQKKEIENVVNKQPKGKLSTAEDIIDAVKKVFAQKTPPLGADGLPRYMEPPKPRPGSESGTPFIDVPKVDKPIFMDPINKGTSANSIYIKSVLNSPFRRLGVAVNKLTELKKIATHDRIPKVVGETVGKYITFLTNIYSAYATAVTEANKFIDQKEKERMSVPGSDASSSLIRLQEVLPFFSKGKVALLGLNGAASFEDIGAKMSQHLSDIGTRIKEGLSPGFDFDEEDLKGISQKSLSLIDEVSSELKSKG